MIEIMTKWLPDQTKLSRPVYLSLAEQMSEAIRNGLLPSGEQLPTHRNLADALGLSVQTVSRAYEELIRRGLISGEVGRGTFVQAIHSEPSPPYLPERLGELIDLSILKPVCESMHLEKMRDAFLWLSQHLSPSAALSFRPNVVFPHHRKVAAQWLALCGVEASPINISLTNGATSAMTTAIMSVVPPGSTLGIEKISHHTLLPLSSYLGIHLESLAMDREGLIPEALEAACRKGHMRALFLQPTVINPRAGMMSLARRRSLAEIAQRHDLAIIENDILGPMVEHRLEPIAALAPERTLFITSFTKTTVPGLRIGYISVPDRYAAAVANRHLVSSWMATPAMAEIATEWVGNGTALELVRWQRAALAERHAIAADVLSGLDYMSHPQSLHVWLPLTGDHAEDAFVAQARLRGVAIAPGRSFHTGEGDWKPAVRISVGSTSAEDFRAGLNTVAALLIAKPEPLLLAI